MFKFVFHAFLFALALDFDKQKWYRGSNFLKDGRIFDKLSNVTIRHVDASINNIYPQLFSWIKKFSVYRLYM